MEHSIYIINFLKEYAKLNGLTEVDVKERLKCSITDYTLLSLTSMPDMRLPGFYGEMDAICRARHCDFLAMMNMINNVMAGYCVVPGSPERIFWRCNDCGVLLVTNKDQGPQTLKCSLWGHFIEEIKLPVFCREANINAKVNELFYDHK